MEAKRPAGMDGIPAEAVADGVDGADEAVAFFSVLPVVIEPN